MPKRRKGFKTSPSIRIPRAAAEKMQAAAAAAAAAAKEAATLRKSLQRSQADIRSLRSAIRCGAEEMAEYMKALKDAVALVDELLRYGGKKDGWTREDAIRLENIRALSVF